MRARGLTIWVGLAALVVIPFAWPRPSAAEVAGSKAGDSPLAAAARCAVDSADGAQMLAFVEEALAQEESDAGQAALWVLGCALQSGDLLARERDEPLRVRAAIDAVTAHLPAASPNLAAYFVLGRARHALDAGRIDEATAALEDFDHMLPGCAEYAAERAILLANGLRFQGRFAASLAVASDALARPELEPKTRADLLGVRSSINVSLGLAEYALDDLLEVERYAADTGDETLAFTAIVGRADCDLGRSRLDLVRERIDAALVREWLPEHGAVLQVYLGLGWLEADPEHARRTLEAIRSAEELPPSYRAVVEFHLAQLAMDVGAAEPEWFGELVGSRQLSPRLTTWQTEMLLQRGGSPAELQDQLDRQSESFDEMLRAWHRVPESETGTSFLHYQERSRRLRGLMHLRMALDDSEVGRAHAFGDLMRAQAATSFARDLGARVVTLARVREEFLAPGRGALVYLPTPVGSDLFAIDRDRIEYFSLPADFDLRAAIDDFEGLLARNFVELPSESRSSVAAGLERRSAELARVLIPERVEELLAGWEGVTIVGPGLWWNLTFEALALRDGRLLGARIAVDSLGSLPFGVARAERISSATEPGVSLLAALSPRNPELTALGARREEFTAIDAKRLLLDSRSRALGLESGCTPSLFIREIARPGGVVHVFAHGVYDGTRRAIGLAFENQTVWPEDLRDARVGSVVFLSTCGAGNARIRRGDDDLVDNIAGALLRGGAPAVVVSRSDVVFGPHLDLAIAFHRALRELATPAAAMRAARESAAPDRLGQFECARIQVFGLGHRPCAIR